MKEERVQEEVKRVYEQWKDALIKTDVTALEELYTDNFSWANNMGIASNKQQNLLKMSCGNIRYISCTDEDMKVDIFNTIATIKTKEVLKMFVYELSVHTTRNIIATFQLLDGKWLISKIEEQKRNV